MGRDVWLLHACATTLVLAPQSVRVDADGSDAALREEARSTMLRAATFYRTNVASHGGYVYYYGWKIDTRLDELETQYRALNTGDTHRGSSPRPTERQRPIRRIINDLDERGRWIDRFNGERLVGQPKMQLGSRHLSSETFSRNLTALSEFLAR